MSSLNKWLFNVHSLSEYYNALDFQVGVQCVLSKKRENAWNIHFCVFSSVKTVSPFLLQISNHWQGWRQCLRCDNKEGRFFWKMSRSRLLDLSRCDFFRRWPLNWSQVFLPLTKDFTNIPYALMWKHFISTIHGNTDDNAIDLCHYESRQSASIDSHYILIVISHSW